MANFKGYIWSFANCETLFSHLVIQLPYIRTVSKIKEMWIRITSVFIILPTNVQMWHKAILRWVRSQGRSPHASVKVKNTFDPVGIPLRRHAINPTPHEGGKSLGRCLPEAGGTLHCRGTPGRTAQRYNGLPNVTQQLERKGPKHPKRASSGAYFLITSNWKSVLR